MVKSELLAIEAIDRAIKKYAIDMQIAFDTIQKIKNESFEEFDRALLDINKYSDGYFESDFPKIKRLKKLIAKYKEIIWELFATLKNDVEQKSGRVGKALEEYSKLVYSINSVRFNNAADLFSELVDLKEDDCVDGSVQNIFGVECYVFGTEKNVESNFTGQQGNNNFGMQQNCGIACVAQLVILSGKKVSENDVVRVAVSEGLCQLNEYSMEENGATSAIHRASLLSKFNLKSNVELANLRTIASYVEHGHGVIVAVDSGAFWNRQDLLGRGHAIVIYGTFHRASDGALLGLIACDTGSGDMKRLIKLSDFERMYLYHHGINVTISAIRN